MDRSSLWDSNFQSFKQFVNEQKRFPMILPSEIHLYKWYQNQKNSIFLPEDKKEKLNKVVLDHYAKTSTQLKWFKKIQLIADFIKANNRFPDKSFSKEERNLIIWLKKQTEIFSCHIDGFQAYALERNHKIRDFLLETLRWEKQFKVLKIFVESRKRLPYNNLYENHLYLWMDYQRRRFKKCKLDRYMTLDRRKKLESFDGWSW